MIQHYLQHFPSGLYGIVVYADATEEALASTFGAFAVNRTFAVYSK